MTSHLLRSSGIPRTVEPVLLAQLLLLGGTLFGATVLVRGYFSRLAYERVAIERFARERAGTTRLAPWGSGYLYGVDGDRTGVRTETFTRATARGGVVDVWTVRRERARLAGMAWSLTRRGATGEGAYDLEGVRDPGALVGPHGARLDDVPGLIEALDPLLSRGRLRRAEIQGGALEVSVDRDASTTQELELVMHAVERLVPVLERLAVRGALAEGARSAAGQGAGSGAPVTVPVARDL